MAARHTSEDRCSPGQMGSIAIDALLAVVRRRGPGRLDCAPGVPGKPTMTMVDSAEEHVEEPL